MDKTRNGYNIFFGESHGNRIGRPRCRRKFHIKMEHVGEGYESVK
jgi:hypothetical protein